jgi:hypothetical protein
MYRKKNTCEDDYISHLISFSKTINIENIKKIQGLIVCDFFKTAKCNLVNNKNKEVRLLNSTDFIEKIYSQKEFRESYMFSSGNDYYNSFQKAYAENLLHKLSNLPIGSQKTASETNKSSNESEFKKGLDQVNRYLYSSNVGQFGIITMRDKTEALEIGNFWASQKNKFILLLDDKDFSDLLISYTAKKLIKLYYEEYHRDFILDNQGINYLLKKCYDQKAKT